MILQRFPLVKFPMTSILPVVVLLSVSVVGNKDGLENRKNVNFSVLTQPPYCYLDLMLPDACKDPKIPTSDRFTKHLYPMRVDFKSEGQTTTNLHRDSAYHKTWNLSETEYCTFKEIPKFPPECIPNDKPTIFRKNANCPNYDYIQIDKNHSYTNGLRISCLAPYPMDLTYEVKAVTPYEGIKVLFSKAEVLNNSDTFYQIHLQIPGTFEPGYLHGFSGNYTFYRVNHPELYRRLKIDIAPRGKGYSTENFKSESIAAEDEAPILDIDGGRIQCMTNDTVFPITLVVVQASNPTETKLLRPCLDNDKKCGAKLEGTTCPSKHCQMIFPTQQQGIARCSYGSKVIEKEFFMGLDLICYTTFNDVVNKTDALISLRLEDGRSYSEHVDDPSDQVDLYDGGIFTFRCYFLAFFLVAPIKWAVEYKNGTRADTEPYQPRESFDFGYGDYESILTEAVELEHPQGESFAVKASQAFVKIFENMKSIHCKATLWNSSEFIASSLSIDVLQSQKPERLSIFEEHLEKVTSLDFELACYWKKVTPKPSFTWIFRNQTLSAVNDSCVKEWWSENTQSSHLHICNSKPKWNGTYICVAENFLGKAFQKIHVKIERDKQATSSQWVYIGIPCVIIAILTVIIIMVYRVNVSQKARLTALEIQAFEKGNESGLNEEQMSLLMTDDIVHSLPYNTDFEVPWKDFQTDNEELGRGAFGLVLRGSIGDKAVAAKTVLPDAEKDTIFALLSEIKIMIYLGKHKHLVEFVGACTEFLRQGRPYLFVEFCNLGSLASFLKGGRESFKDELPTEQQLDAIPVQHSGYVDWSAAVGDQLADRNTDTYSCYLEQRIKFSTTDLIKWSSQIADAMEYLESKRVIHGDLAARNVLLTSTLDVKVTDFGLARQLNNYSMYIKTHETPVPWRWMAIESLRDMVFTSKSDVWSFGITLWEIFTLAEIPYPGTAWNTEFVESLESGYRMKRPRFASIQIFEQIKSCWKYEPELRPNFTKLKQYFTALYHSGVPDTGVETGLNSSQGTMNDCESESEL